MDNVRILRYDWYTGRPGYGRSGEYLARQYDHLSDMVVLEHAPKLNNYYLIVTMKETEDGDVKTLEPIQLSGSYWLIPNIYTQLAQEISFQFCCKTESGDFEAHSAQIHGSILPSKDHNGAAIDVDPSVMFDPYKQWVSEIAMAAGAIVVDSELSDSSTNPVQNRIVKAVVDGLLDDVEAVTDHLLQQDTTIDEITNISPNLCDRSAFTENVRFVGNGDTTQASNTYAISDHIPIESVLTFWRATTSGVATCGVFQTAQYDENKEYIADSLVTNSAVQIYSVEALEGASYVRIAFTYNRLNAGAVGVYEGTTKPLEITPYGIRQVKIPNKFIGRDKMVDFIPPPILYTFEDAFVHWQNGEKFPIMFCGDSTTDGPGSQNNSLDNPTDFIDETAYPYVLEQMLIEATGNSTLRIYNAGYSGKSILNFTAAFDAVMEVYSDAKMAGISFGINDVAVDPFYYYDHASTPGYANRLRTLVEMFYALGIQPFMITSQTMAQVNNGSYREQYRVQQWCNKAKFDVAREYGIPCIDIATLTQLFTMFSSVPSTQIYKDIVHYGVAGHKYEAGVFFREFYPLVETVKSKTIIGPGNRYIKSDLNAVQRIATDVNGLKFEWSATNLSEDKTILSTYVFIEHEGPLSVRAYCSSASGQVITIDGVSTTVTETETDLGTLDVGLHKIVVTSGGQSDTNFKGLKISDDDFTSQEVIDELIGIITEAN